MFVSVCPVINSVPSSLPPESHLDSAPQHLPSARVGAEDGGRVQDVGCGRKDDGFVARIFMEEIFFGGRR